MDSEGNPTVTLSKEGTTKIFKVCDLMAMSFKWYNPNNPNEIVEHIDWNKENNHADNIRVVYI